MRILILTPTAFPSVTGNAMTAERWRRSLVQRESDVQILATRGLNALDLLREIRRFKPGLIHVHHAFRAGILLLDSRVAAECGSLPLVVSPAGTDINGDLESGEKKEAVLQVFRRAHAVIAQGRGTLERLKEVLSDFRHLIFHVPKSICWLGCEAFGLRESLGWQSQDFLFFLPAGIRPVKRNLECLNALERVHAIRPRVRAIFGGPALETEYADRFEEQVKRLSSFARWVPLVPPESMRSAYQAADVVLNTSFSEGLSNAILEAMAAGRPVLASDIQGNRWPILGEDGDLPSGCLFDPNDPEDFIKEALRLVDDDRLREALGEAGRDRAAKWPSPEEEAEGLMLAYKTAIQLT